MADLPSQPVKDTETSFSLFNWLRKVWLWLKPLSESISVDDATDTITFTNDAYVGSNVIYHAGNFVGAKLKSELLATPGTSTWTWPTGVDLVWVTLVGGGGGGAGARNGLAVGAQGGGGAGETLYRYPVLRLGATTKSYTVGSGGAGGAGSTGTTGNSGGNGTATYFGTLKADYGYFGEYSGTSSKGGKGGGRLQPVVTSGGVVGADAVVEGLTTISGGNGGGGLAASPGLTGGGCEANIGGFPGNGNGCGGGGGSCFLSIGGTGADATNGTAAKPATPGYGAGGGGGGANTSGAATAGGTGGDGGSGCIIIEWIG